MGVVIDYTNVTSAQCAELKVQSHFVRNNLIQSTSNETQESVIDEVIEEPTQVEEKEQESIDAVKE